jgi:fucose permease
MSRVSATGALLIAGLAMGTLGIITAGVGPALPNLATNNTSTLAGIGALFSAMYIGGIGAQLLGGYFNDRFGQRTVMIVGMIILALGSAGMISSQTLWLTLACAAVSGIGRGTLSITAHLLVARVFAERSASAFNMLNVFYGIGAIASPALASVALNQWDTALPVIALGVAMLILQLPLILLLDGKLPGLVRRGEANTPYTSPLHDPLLWLCGFMVLLYTGVEVGYSGWITSYLEHSLPITTAAAAQMNSALWICMTLGRVLAAIFGTRIGAGRLFQICSLSVGVGFIGFLLSAGNQNLTFISVLFLGLVFGPMYPTAMAIITQTFKRTPSTATSIASAMGSVGATILPWLQGNLLEYSSPTSSMALLAGVMWLFILLNFVRMALTKRRSEAEPHPSESASP